MSTTADKQELIDWIKELKDRSILESIQTIKNSQTDDDWWNKISQDRKRRRGPRFGRR